MLEVQTCIYLPTSLKNQKAINHLPNHIRIYFDTTQAGGELRGHILSGPKTQLTRDKSPGTSPGG